MKQDKEPAISLPVYFKSVKKWKYVLRKNKKKTKGPKKEKSFQQGESKSGPPTFKVNAFNLLHLNN